jgi:serine/threonine-protein kinase
MVLEQDPPNIRMLNRGVDSDLEMVVMKCLQKPTDLRYASTVELADDLRAWLSGEPVSARSSTFAQVMMRLFRESHHAAILQNWGLLWMWHSLVVLCLCHRKAAAHRVWPNLTSDLTLDESWWQGDRMILHISKNTE